MPSDEPDKISHKKMQTAGILALAIALESANYPHNFKFKKLPRPTLSELFRFDTRTPRLGIYPGDLDEEDYEALGIDEKSGAVYVEEIIPNSVADNCGLKADDVIIEFDGQKLSREDPTGSLRSLIARVKRKTPIKIVIIRNGEKKTLEATFK